MLNKFRNLKLNIRQHVLLLIFGCCLFTFLVIIAVAFYTFLDIQDAVRDKSDIMEIKISDSLGDFSETSIKERLAENAELRALYIDRELSVIGEDVKFLSNSISSILKSPEQYNPRKIAEIREQEDFFSGEPYLVYSPALLRQGINAELAHEIDIVSNFADDLISLSRTYQGYQTSFYAGSRKGYFVCVDLLPSNGTPRSIYATKEMRENLFSYDPRERLWYKMGEKATRPVYTDPYKTTEGAMGITCTMPYYDNDEFAGVVGIGCNIADVYRQVADGVIGETGFNVVMNSEGKIIFSTDMEYISSELRHIA